MLTSRPIIIALAGLSTLAFTGLAEGQNLSERINHVMRQRAAAQANNPTKAQLLGTLLYTDLTVQFQDTPVRDVITYLNTVLGIEIVGRFNDDRTGIGIDPESPITLNVTNKPALTVLEMVLAQCEEDDACTWQLRNGYVEVGTKERLSAPAAREVRYYPIKDMLFDVPMFDNAPTLDLDTALNQGQNQGGQGGGGGGGGGFGGGGSGGGQGGSIFGGSAQDDPDRRTEEERVQQIIDLITDTIEPDAWDIAGGDWATIRYYQGVLIIKAPDYIHRQIGGYPFAIRPAVATQVSSIGTRYVTFTGGLSDVQLKEIRTSGPFAGSTGGSSGGSGGGAPSPAPTKP